MEFVNVTGQSPSGDFISVKWQEGTVLENDQNGAQVEDVIRVALDRLKYLNGILQSEDNEDAITMLEGAIAALDMRTADRKARGVEGTNEQ